MCFVGISNSFIYLDVTQMSRKHYHFSLNLIMRSLPKNYIHEYFSFKICRFNVVTAMNFNLQKFLAFLLAKMCMLAEVWSFLQIVFKENLIISMKIVITELNIRINSLIVFSSSTKSIISCCAKVSQRL